MSRICFIVTMLLNAVAGWCGKSGTPGRFAIYYGTKADAAEFKPFDLVVLESDYTRIVPELKKEHKTVLGYLSIGEVHRGRDYFTRLKERGLLLGGNPNWADAYYIDIRKPFWREFIVDSLVPALLDAGFDGIFVDTLDSSIEQERVDPLRFKGMKAAAVEIIRAVRRNFPDIRIMVNRGFDLAGEIAPEIDYLLAESICNSYDFKRKRYFPVELNIYRSIVRQLHEIMKKNPRLLVLTLDYCGEKDLPRRREIRRLQKKNGFIPYITTISLDKVDQIDDN